MILLRRPPPQEPAVPAASPDRSRRRPEGAPSLAWARRTLARAAPTRPAFDDAPDLDEIFASRPPGPLRLTLYGVVALVVALVAAASLIRADIVVSAPGRLLADAPTIVLQPLQLSIIRELRVKAGDSVRKGDVLASLDPTFAQADRSTLVAQQTALRAEIDRIQAELDGTEPRFVGESRDVQLQASLYRQRQSQFAAQLRAYDAEIQRITGSMGTAKVNAVSLRLQFDVYTELESMYAKLYSKSVASRVTYLGSSVSRMKAERDSQEEQNRLSELTNQLATKQAERQVFIDKWRSDLMDALIKARREEKSLSENVVKANLMTDLVALVAPEDGIVIDVARRSVGSVVQPAEPILTLLPSGAPLYADVSIASADVGYTKAGDAVTIKIDAFPYQRHGSLTGRLRSIGMDAAAMSLGPSGGMPQLHPAGGVAHRGQIVLTGSQLRNLPEGASPMPGMSVTADIKVGTRSVISYFIYPLKRGFDEAIREP
ncbi:HlyD family type I secretion periplasmic adaptor subunit [Methylobacterium sp. ID0610]|uniref:HlyD family type I secretion periplasmic adaptor subunit n=1 Tax=Methylobacterium carpenticola TaxID=3344827 RepID=UPI0036738AF8